MSSTINWVAAGVGVTIVPESMSHLQTHLVVYKRIAGGAPRATMSLAIRSGAVSPAIEKFVEEVDRVFGKKRSRAALAPVALAQR
jgi:DNA-binding transcriptional LysR family regulator